MVSRPGQTPGWGSPLATDPALQCPRCCRVLCHRPPKMGKPALNLSPVKGKHTMGHQELWGKCGDWQGQSRAQLRHKGQNAPAMSWGLFAWCQTIGTAWEWRYCGGMQSDTLRHRTGHRVLAALPCLSLLLKGRALTRCHSHLWTSVLPLGPQHPGPHGGRCAEGLPNLPMSCGSPCAIGGFVIGAVWAARGCAEASRATCKKCC